MGKQANTNQLPALLCLKWIFIGVGWVIALLPITSQQHFPAPVINFEKRKTQLFKHCLHWHEQGEFDRLSLGHQMLVHFFETSNYDHFAKMENMGDLFDSIKRIENINLPLSFLRESEIIVRFFKEKHGESVLDRSLYFYHASLAEAILKKHAIKVESAHHIHNYAIKYMLPSSYDLVGEFYSAFQGSLLLAMHQTQLSILEYIHQELSLFTISIGFSNERNMKSIDILSENFVHIVLPAQIFRLSERQQLDICFQQLIEMYNKVFLHLLSKKYQNCLIPHEAQWVSNVVEKSTLSLSNIVEERTSSVMIKKMSYVTNPFPSDIVLIPKHHLMGIKNFTHNNHTFYKVHSVAIRGHSLPKFMTEISGRDDHYLLALYFSGVPRNEVVSIEKLFALVLYDRFNHSAANTALDLVEIFSIIPRIFIENLVVEYIEFVQFLIDYPCLDKPPLSCQFNL